MVRALCLGIRLGSGIGLVTGLGFTVRIGLHRRCSNSVIFPINVHILI